MLVKDTAEFEQAQMPQPVCRFSLLYIVRFLFASKLFYQRKAHFKKVCTENVPV